MAGVQSIGPNRAEPTSPDTKVVAATVKPDPVVPGFTFDDRIYTLDELKSQYAAQGLTHVEGDPSAPISFVAASYNILGSSHAKNGPSRAARGGAKLRAAGVSVVGLQEVQANQRNPLLNAAGMVAFPAEGVDRLAADNSIAWDPNVWELVEGRMQKITYFHGKRRNMPIVLLRHRESSRLTWWMNVHNPADVFGCKCAKWRAQALSDEIAMINQLKADGTPVFFTGDLNDRSAAVCRIAVGTGLASADGSHAAGGKGGSCRPASNLWIDWLWGSGDQVTFTNHVRDFSTRNSPRMSDHPIVRATTTIAPAAEAQGCKSYTRHGEKYWFCPDPTGS